MGWILFLVVGGLIGWVASLLMGTDAQQGIFANIVVGVVGAALGGWLAPRLGIQPESTLGVWAVSIGGAVVLIALLRVFGVFR